MQARVEDSADPVQAKKDFIARYLGQKEVQGL